MNGTLMRMLGSGWEMLTESRKAEVWVFTLVGALAYGGIGYAVYSLPAKTPQSSTPADRGTLVTRTMPENMQITHGDAEVEIGQVITALDASKILAVISQHQGEIADCYDRHVDMSQFTGGGNVNLFIALTPSGAVQNVSFMNAVRVGPPVTECIAAAVRGWSFPGPAGGQGGHAIIPLILTKSATVTIGS